ncbi:MAG TPA: cytochrome bd-I oxidase subunit CydX [Thiothrix sp.]|nr:cytochrome bd-I oxidase subunit CydX [Thiothrix sp.]
MWYFAWMLGVGFAASLAVINVMWLEINVMSKEADEIEMQQDSND